MPDAPLSHLEDARLSALEELNLLEVQASPEFDIFPLLASQILSTPVAAITLVGRDTQFIKAGVGIPEMSAPRSHSICEYAILQPSDALTIQDATLDPRVFDKPSVTAKGGIRSYAGVAISGPSGLPLGTLCVADKVPRSFSAADLVRLKELAGGVETAIRLHATTKRTRQHAGTDPLAVAVAEIASELKAFIGTVVTPIVKSSVRDNKAKLLLTSMFARINAPILLVDDRGGIMMANSAFRALVGFSPHELKSMNLDQFTSLLVDSAAAEGDEQSDEEVFRATCDVKTKSGAAIAVTLTSVVVDFEHHRYKVITMIPASSRLKQSELSPEFALYASQSIGEFRPISLAALRSALGVNWKRVGLRAMLSAEHIIRKRLDRDDVITRLDDETFAVWFNNGNRLQNDEALSIINRDLRVRLLTEFGDELRDYLQIVVSPEEETLVAEPIVAA